MNTINIETPSKFITEYLDEITVMTNGEERLQIDKGRPPSRAIFLEVEQVLDQFTTAMINSGLDLDRDFDAAFLLGRKMRTDNKYRWHATRSLAIMADIGLFQIVCINPESSGAKRYKIVPDRTTRH